jgi:two-component system CheB/CheR fusion protein
MAYEAAHDQRLVAVVGELENAHDLEKVTAVVRRAIRALTGADGATFVLREGSLVRYVDEDAIGPLWKGIAFPIRSCVSGWVIEHDRATAVADVYDDPRVPIEAYRSTFVRSMAMAPIRGSQPVGALGAYWAKTGAPTEEKLGILQGLADAVGAALAKRALLE